MKGGEFAPRPFIMPGLTARLGLIYSVKRRDFNLLDLFPSKKAGFHNALLDFAQYDATLDSEVGL